MILPIIPWRQLAIVLILLLVFLPRYGAAQSSEIPEILDAELSDYPYPYPVDYIQLKNENKACQMAYMDVAPKQVNPSKPAVVLLHGKNFMGAYWRQTIKYLSGIGYRVIVPDQIGFGKSSKPSLHYSFHQLATNTRQLLDSLGVSKAIIVGHSMGGMLATRFALMYPEVVTKLVLENPIGLEDYRTLVPYSTLEASYQRELKTTEESIFSGVIGVGFYPIMGSRVWCRFGCPMAAYLGILQKHFSRFRITTNGGQCISCGNCSNYCEMGIDVRWYAQQGQPIIRSSCVGCGMCATVCPRGVLNLENGPREGRYQPSGFISPENVRILS